MVMDFDREATLAWQGGGPADPWEGTEAGVMCAAEDPRPGRARAILAAERSRRATPIILVSCPTVLSTMTALPGTPSSGLPRLKKTPAAGPSPPRGTGTAQRGVLLTIMWDRALVTRAKFKKDVNLEGTNSTSPLESLKCSKNELKTNSKRSGKTCLPHAN